MSASVDGFRRNLEQTLPELAREYEGKEAKTEAALKEIRAELAWIRGVAAAGGVEVGSRKKASNGDDAALSE